MVIKPPQLFHIDYVILISSSIWTLIKADDFESNKFQNDENVKNFHIFFSKKR